MKKFLKPAAFVAVILVTLIVLTSGIDKRSGGYKDLVDEFYEQAVKQNSNLKSIEEGIDAFYKKREDALEKYNSFTAYNSRYYADARSHANTIPDATTKQRAAELVNKSEAAYLTKLSNWQSSITSLNSKERELKSLHELLKLMIATPVIENYQQNNLPGNSKLNEANGDLQQLVEKIKAITR